VLGLGRLASGDSANPSAAICRLRKGRNRGVTGEDEHPSFKQRRSHPRRESSCKRDFRCGDYGEYARGEGARAGVTPGHGRKIRGTTIQRVQGKSCVVEPPRGEKSTLRSWARRTERNLFHLVTQIHIRLKELTN